MASFLDNLDPSAFKNLDLGLGGDQLQLPMPSVGPPAPPAAIAAAAPPPVPSAPNVMQAAAPAAAIAPAPRRAPAAPADDPNDPLPEGDPGTTPDGQEVYYSRTAKHYLTAPAYLAQRKVLGATGNLPDPKVLAESRKHFEEVKAAANAVQQNALLANDFAQRNSHTGTGGPLQSEHVRDFVMANGGWIPGATELGAMQNDNMKMASAAARAISSRPGQQEFLNLLKVQPAISSAGNVNDQIVKQANDANIMSRAYRSFYAAWMKRTGGSDVGIDDAWETFRSKNFSPQGRYVGPGSPYTRGAGNAGVAGRSAPGSNVQTIPLNP